MSNEKSALALNDAEIPPEVARPQIFAAGKGQVPPAVSGGCCTSHRMTIRRFRPGCIP